MGYQVEIRRNADGLIRTYTESSAWALDPDSTRDEDGPSWFWWEEYNGGCDCERARCFAAAVGDPDPDEPCVLDGDACRYTVLRFILPDGRIIDPHEKVP
jgi:hypothetical protein